MRARSILVTAALLLFTEAGVSATAPGNAAGVPAPRPTGTSEARTALVGTGPKATTARVLVRFRTAVPASGQRTAAADAGGTIARRLGKLTASRRDDLCVVTSDTVGTAALVARLSADPDVALVEPDALIRIDDTTPNDTLYGSLWGMTKIAAPAAWDLTTGSPSVVIANIDTGVDYTHPDLAPNMWHNDLEWAGTAHVDDDGNGYIDDLYGIDTSAGDSDPMDDVDNSHGTHTAGTIAAVCDNALGVAGVGWQTQIMALKSMGADGLGTTSQAIDCIDYAIHKKTQDGVNIVAINASWGSDTASAFLKYSIELAGDAGIVFVTAAGNAGVDNDVTPHYPAAYDCRNIVAVANSTEADGRRASSCWGATTVDLAAPGTNILSTVRPSTDPSGYTTLSGTSMAAPHVSGVVALGASLFPDEDVEERIDRVLRGVDPLPLWTDLCATGGRLNAYGALTAAVPTDDDVPGFRLHASPVTGTVSALDDAHDVYRVRIKGGQTLQAAVTGDAGGEVDLYLFAPTATTVADHGAAVAQATAAAYPDGLCYETPDGAEGTYYLAAHCPSGESSYTYTISWSIGSNDDIPGATMTPSPAGGALSATEDVHDVWALSLASGQVLEAGISALGDAPLPEFGLALFEPWQTSVAGVPLAISSSGTYPRTLARQVKDTGLHYLDARALDGAGNYTVAYSVTTVPDNEIPGVPLPSPPVQGLDDSLTADTDLCDVYAVHLDFGQTLQATVTTPEGSGCDLLLFAPEATNCWQDAAADFAFSYAAPYEFAYPVTSTGTYYLVVKERSGASTTYHLVWSASEAPLDLSPPETTAAGLPEGWADAPVTVTFSATDDLSGVAYTEYSLDGGEYVRGTSVPISTGGRHTLSYRSVDRAANVEEATSAAVDVDLTAPVTTATGLPGGWRTRPVTVTFSAGDALSGVAYTEYSVDGGAYVQGTSATIATAGRHTLSYRSVDVAGNVETARSSPIDIDLVAPGTTPLGITEGAWVRRDVSVRLQAADDLAGVARIEYRLRNSAWAVYTVPVAVTAEGTTRVEYRAVDNAGNTEAAKTTTVRIDKTGPTTTASNKLSVRRKKPATFRFKVIDRTASAKVIIRVYKGTKLKKTLTVGRKACGSLQRYTWTRCTLPKGKYTWKVFATDEAGNRQIKTGSRSLTVK
jgi:subtilisin family serine protease